jgi:predicted Zn-dependent protease
MSPPDDSGADAGWPVRFHDGAATAWRPGVARLEGDVLVVRFGADARRDFPVAGVALLCAPSGAARGMLVPDGGGAARIVFADPGLAAALVAHVAHRRGRRASARRAACRSLAIAIPALAALAALFVVVLPLLAGVVAAILPAETERRFGAVMARHLAASLARAPDGAEACRGTAGRAALGAMFERLVAAAGDLPHPPLLHVVDSDRTNAYALPGGRIVLLAGLIDAARSPDEVAGVLAHELAHVAHRDPVRAMVRSAALSALAGMLAGDPGLAAGLATLGVHLLGLSHSRDAEMRADARATEILARAGLATDGLADLFARLAARAGGGAAVHGYLSTHPPLPARARRAAPSVPSQASPPALAPADWQALRRDCAAAG